ncbi:MAG: hypothetical protein CMC76_03460 [Flavobacteriaceae bacterium]|nr:hypothetical protein [Flavobacteriaceae bacterium]
MKKITFLLALIAFNFNSWAQCTTNTGGQWPSSTITLANSGAAETIASNNWPNAEFSLIDNVLAGSDYTVAGTGMFITVTNTADSSIITSGSNSVSFTAGPGLTGITVFWHLDALCGTNNGPNTLTTIQCTTCTCPETSAPSVATLPTPSDGATDIMIDDSDPDNLLITPFSWTDGTVGGSVESTNLSLGTTPTGDDIGTITGATNGNGIIYTWQPNTTYYWFVESINCFGSTTSPVWSFTTSSCTLSAPDAINNVVEPIDGAVDVAIDTTDPANLLVTPFSWTDPITGDAPSSYNLSLGVTPTGDDIGTITGAGNGNGIIYTWAYSTTYYWYVEGVNCGGTGTASPVWSFTTEADPNLSISEFSKSSFNHYYDNDTKILNIESSTSTLTSIEIYSITGKNVISKKLSNSREAINLSELTDGIYLAKVNINGNSKTVKFVKN